MTPKLLDHEMDRAQGVVRYDLGDGRYVAFSLRDVREYGAEALLRDAGAKYEAETRRLPVYRDGVSVGTLPPGFDPFRVESRSFLYDPRPGDFRRQGDRWIACPTLGLGDLEAVPGFERHRALNTPSER